MSLASLLSSAAKDLSHVPCKFFKANSCTAGKACPFSHDVGTPGVSKPVCQWFAKGNCKFGHKCALAHVLPGQPLSWDRKNKRAAQQALRDAQATADSTGLVTATHATAQSSRPTNGDANGLVQTLRQSVDLAGGGGNGGAARAGEYVRYQQAHAQQYGANGSGGVEAVFGSPDSAGQRISPASPPVQHRSIPPQHLQHDSPHAPLNFCTLAHGPTATFVAPASSGLSHHFGSTSPNGRSSVAAHAMLSEQARRLSSTSESLSPPRMPQQLSRARVSFTGGSSPGPPPSPPLAVPVAQAGAGPGGVGGSSIFGTSPFSGSRGLFIPSSYDSNEDGAGGFPRSPPVRPSMLGDHLQRPSSSGMMTLGAPWQDAVADDDEYGNGDDANADEFDEGFLPSSLNELLTDEEFTRRTRRANHQVGAGPSSLSSSSPMHQSFDPFLNSKSVPAELLLAAGKPSLAPPPSAVLLPHPSLGARSASHTAATSFGLLSSSVEGHNPSATPYQPAPPGASNGGGRGSLLAQSRTREATVVLDSPGGSVSAATPPTSSLLGAALSGYPPASASAASGIYSASYSDAAGFHRSPSFAAAAAAATSASGAGALSVAGHPLPPRYPQTGLSPGTNASLALPGSSLPGGLAAGLSRLHLVPPSHTGETPPTSSYAAAAASPPGSGSGPGSFSRRAASGSFVGSPLAQHESALRLGVPGSVGARAGSGRAGASASAGGSSGAATPEPQSAATERPPRGQGLAHARRSGNHGAGSAEGSAEEDDGLEGGEVEDIQFEME